MAKTPKTTSDPDCRPGSIKQQLDMCETGPLRGDEIQHTHGGNPPDPIQDNFGNEETEVGVLAEEDDQEPLEIRRIERPRRTA